MATSLRFSFLKMSTNPGLEDDGSGGIRIKAASGIARSESGISLDTSASPSFVRLTLTQTTGTAPFTISSTTTVANLSAALWDGYARASYLNQDVRTTASPSFNGLTIAGANYLKTYQTGLVDVNSGFYLYMGCVSSTISGDQNLFFNVGNASRTITLNGNPTLNDWFDQAIKSTSSPTHVRLTLSQATGTAPFTISSTTVVSNLNADLWDGYQFADYIDQAVKSSSSPTHVRLTLSQATGTAPFTISSTTVCSNLNADYLDGLHSASFARLDASTNVNGGILSCYNPDGYTIDNVNGDRARLQIYQATGETDAFMAFHVSGDFACYFGLDGSTNALSVGGWSMGANVYRILHEGLSDAVLPGTLSVATDIYSTAWTDYSASSTVSGFSSVSNAYIYYKKVGKTIICWFYILGVSNATTFSFTLPVVNRAISSASLCLIRVQDNSNYATEPGWAAVASSSSTVSLHKTLTGNNGWTASNNKLGWGQIMYESA